MKKYRYVFTVILLLGFCLLLYLVIINFESLSNVALAGPAIVGLAFLLIGLFGMHLQVASELEEDAGFAEVAKSYLRYCLQFFSFIVLFVAYIWGLVAFFSIVVPLWFGDWADYIGLLYLPAFLGSIYLLIKILVYLSDRNIIGPK